MWRYLAKREDGEDAEAPLFTVKYDRSMNKTALRFLIKHLGDKAGIKKCHPHRFRHTFAITYLRSGGDVFTLQALLGHSIWIWFNAMLVSLKSILSRLTSAPARPITGDCNSRINLPSSGEIGLAGRFISLWQLLSNGHQGFG